MVKNDEVDIKQIVSEVSLISSIYLFVFGAGIFIFQLYYWLHDGHWKKLSVLDGLEYLDEPPMGGHLDWLYSPHSWIDFHSLLQHFSLSLTFFFLSVLTYVVYKVTYH